MLFRFDRFALFLTLILSVTANADATKNCDVAEHIRKLTEFSTSKGNNKYARLPPLLQDTLELRDVYTPLVIEMEKRVSTMTPDAVSKQIAAIQNEWKFFDRISYDQPNDKVFRANDTLWDASRGVISEIRNGRAEFETRGSQSRKSFTGKFQDYAVLLPDKYGSEWKVMNQDMITVNLWLSINPIGEYGKEFARSLAHTQAILRSNIFAAMKNKSKKIYADHTELFNRASFLGSNEGPTSPHLQMQEGLMSVNQAVSLLLAERIPGISTYREAMKQLLSKRGDRESLMTEFSGKLPIGLIAPSSIAGRYFPKPLVMTNDGLALSPELLETMKLGRKDQQSQIAIQRVMSNGLGIGCPIFHTKGCAVDQSGMQSLYDAYLRAFELVDDELHARR